MSEGQSKEEQLERLALLTLLQGNTDALRLIVTWPNKEIRVEGHSARDKARCIMKWAMLADVRPKVVEELWPMLFGNKFVTRDGGVDPLTLTWARRELAKEIGL